MRGDDLHRAAILESEARAQRLVPLHEIVECEAQRFDVQPSVKPKGLRLDVNRSHRQQPIEEPHSLLGERRNNDIAFSRRFGDAAIDCGRVATLDGIEIRQSWTSLGPANPPSRAWYAEQAAKPAGRIMQQRPCQGDVA